ncbi:Arm DNA-binding domain-containing protein [Nioella sp.]|uniref:Arm DNA-binding domain-containing protein n=1 Tax=Nioella sp. TaxID=1912091 RepID=UPI003A899BDE
MPRKPKELSALDVRRLSASGLHAVGGVAGLCLNITGSGAKSWILRATIGSRRREMGLGAFPDVGLAEARNLAREAKSVIARGGDPIEERRAAQERLRATQRKGMLFRDLVERFSRARRDRSSVAKSTLTTG